MISILHFLLYRLCYHNDIKQMKYLFIFLGRTLFCFYFIWFLWLNSIFFFHYFISWTKHHQIIMIHNYQFKWLTFTQKYNSFLVKTRNNPFVISFLRQEFSTISAKDVRKHQPNQSSREKWLRLVANHMILYVNLCRIPFGRIFMDFAIISITIYKKLWIVRRV